jgi:hypothetical protein
MTHKDTLALYHMTSDTVIIINKVKMKQHILIHLIMRQNSSVSLVTDHGLDEWGLILDKKMNFLSVNVSRQALGLLSDEQRGLFLLI